MNTWHSFASNNPSSSQRATPDWFEVLLPTAAIPLILLLLFILPIFLLTAESLFVPVYEFLRSLLIPVNAGVPTTFIPFSLILKIILFTIFAFTGVTLLLLKISCLYHEVWGYFLGSPHPMHVPYHPDQQKSMVALFNWNLFRWYKILGPFLGFSLLTVLVGTLGLLLFSSFTDFGFFSFQLQFTLGFFILSVLGLLTGLSLMKGLQNAVTTMLGDVAAITEPEKPTQTLYERSQRLAFVSPKSFFLYPLYLVFIASVMIEVILLLALYNIQDILQFSPDILPVFALGFATFVVFLLISGMKFITYHDALERYYKQQANKMPF